MSRGPCARCEQTLDLLVGDTVWFCMECAHVGGTQAATGYTYWLCTGCHDTHGSSDHTYKVGDNQVQHHLGKHMFICITNDDALADQEGYSEFLQMGATVKDLRIMDGAFEMLKDRRRNAVSVDLMAEQLEIAEGKICHPGGARGALAAALGVRTVDSIWVDRLEFIGMFIRMVMDFINKNDLFEQFHLLLAAQPKRVVALDCELQDDGIAILRCRGLDGSVLASLSVEEKTAMKDVETQLVDILGLPKHRLKLVASNGTTPVSVSAGATVAMLLQKQDLGEPLISAREPRDAAEIVSDKSCSLMGQTRHL
eukprot:gnl/TRDRNA2_/TRDRNA2_75366_c0_seq1.p1 gnl/TRDRNA2_/TRDRNA2_75366_c0~~gnl/TRDRNA2_/TRDRNA2_75366_c0_seq1.p1  ORF type:complete len:311 (-),score=64.19 gnl/TRDRNA2_/TRDRNA2_75366_c0_seq1:14-946(-)